MRKSAEIALELAADSPGAFSSHMCKRRADAMMRLEIARMPAKPGYTVSRIGCASPQSSTFPPSCNETGHDANYLNDFDCVTCSGWIDGGSAQRGCRTV